MAISTYGFDGTSGSKDVNAGDYSPSNPSGGVATREGSAEDYLWKTIDGRDKDHTGNVRGQSPVTGLDIGNDVCNSNWEQTSVLGDEISYVGNNAPIGSGTANTLDGQWPIKYDPFPGQSVVTHNMPKRPDWDSWDSSATVGSAASAS